MNEEQQNAFVNTTRMMMDEAHRLAREKGWYDNGERDPLNLLFLIVSELAEAGEAIRTDPSMPSKKVPDFTELEEEMAGTVIRLMDACAYWGVRLPDAILAFHEYNKSRPYRHGGKRY